MPPSNYKTTPDEDYDSHAFLGPWWVGVFITCAVVTIGLVVGGLILFGVITTIP